MLSQFRGHYTYLLSDVLFERGIKMRGLLLASVYFFSFISLSAADTIKKTYDIVLAGKSCKETSTQMLNCSFHVGNDLYFTIDGIGAPDTGITFMKSSFKGDYYATYGLLHGCVIVKKGLKYKEFGAVFDIAFVSPKNGKVYRSWGECQTAM